jgi:heptose-I-phosphate ethanolaminephosphotransferase
MRMIPERMVNEAETMIEPPGKPAALLFSADHGQEVGHFRNHAGQSPVDNSGYEIPLLLWESPVGAIVGRGQGSALEGRPYQTDYLDHTVSGLLKLTSAYYVPERDVLSPRFQPTPRPIHGLPYVAGASACTRQACTAVH